jgi:hypothetical protein
MTKLIWTKFSHGNTFSGCSTMTMVDTRIEVPAARSQSPLWRFIEMELHKPKTQWTGRSNADYGLQRGRFSLPLLHAFSKEKPECGPILHVLSFQAPLYLITLVRYVRPDPNSLSPFLCGGGWRDIA